MENVNRRATKYTREVLEILRKFRHATNAEIVQILRENHPGVSDTTVHRITQRLRDDGEIGLAPATKQGCLRYDFRAEPHDHFVCANCDNLRDITIPADVRVQIGCELGDCQFDGPLVISGTCKKCQK